MQITKEEIKQAFISWRVGDRKHPENFVESDSFTDEEYGKAAMETLVSYVKENRNG